jgi:serine phosphatase RsbU (regulator of sigma subunit)
MYMKFFITVVFALTVTFAYSQEMPDSLKTKLAGKSATEQVAYINKITNLQLKSSPSVAYQLAKVSMRIANESGDKNSITQCQLLMGKTSRLAGKAAEGIDYLNKAITTLTAANHAQGLASAYSDLAMAYRETGKNNDAVSSFIKSQEYYNQLGDKKGEYMIASNLGTLHVRMYQNAKAIDVFKRAYELAESLGEKQNMATQMSQLGVAYANTGNNKEALECLTKAKEIAVNLNNSALLATINANMENLNQNIVNKEKVVAGTSTAITTPQDDEYMAKLKEEYMSIKAANLKSLEEIEKLSVENQAKEYRLVALQNQFEKQELEIQIKENNLKLLETENNLAKTEVARQTEQIAYQRNILIVVFAAIGVLLILLVFIFRLYISKKKTLKIVEAQKNEIQKQKEVIQEGIEYARHIQQAIIPSPAVIQEALPGFFVFLRPRDVVSGDFYWHYREGSKTFLAAVDCTGHGVAGGLMSMIANSLLNKIIRENKVHSPEKILETLNNNVVETLAQSGDYFDSSMDISICVVDDASNEIQLSLAGHRCIATVNGDIKDFDGSEAAIGGMFPKMNLSYERFVLPRQSGVNVFMFSDGYPDQDGKDGKKLGTNKFVDFLKEELVKEVPARRTELLESHLKNWMGPKKQRDDILVMGFRIE